MSELTPGQRLAGRITTEALDEPTIAVLIDAEIDAALTRYRPTIKSYNVDCAPLHSVTRAFCAVSGCDEPRTGRKPYCKKHHMRWLRHGDPEIVLRSTRAPADRIPPNAAPPIGDLTIAQAAERCNVSGRRIQELIYVGTLAAQKIGKVWLLQRESVEAYAASPRTVGRPPKKAEQ